MSECVVRMEMPTSCEKCPACDYEEGNCLLADDRNTLPHNGKRRSWCPIICSLPEGHGRLVDADKLKEHSVHFGETEYTFDFDAVFVEEIDEAPTIVPAERSEA